MPFGRHACSAERVHLSGHAYDLAAVCVALSRCAGAGVITLWQRESQQEQQERAPKDSKVQGHTKSLQCLRP